ncbi:hypothetical protein K7G92_000763 [Pasteurella canis]|uniref:hypothetical protein n=1 Tax=Pasteurella canis TaxID=753 RepID=UPI001E4B0095|nr:hypothetical protein [Pasteurella canis]MDY0685686.1 hypothetical protein [Pasteurella multocida]UEA17553.1 hypothetical protein K7G92_000763 [Pasteurella canis]
MEFAGKKKFKVSTKTFESIEIYAVFEIDFDFPKVKERIIEMSTFWSGSPEPSDPLIEHIQFVLPIATDSVYDIARRIFWLSSVNDIDKNLWNKTEGFAYCEYIGIKLIDFHADEVSADIFEVEEIEE